MTAQTDVDWELEQFRRWNEMFVAYKKDKKEFWARHYNFLNCYIYSDEATRNASFVQFLSKCFKLSRRASHPERLIGVRSDTCEIYSLVNDTDEGSKELLILLCWNFLNKIVLQCHEKEILFRNHYIYFILILIKDTTKESHKFDGVSPQEVFIFHVKCMYCFIPYFVYSPITSKYFDLIQNVIKKSFMWDPLQMHLDLKRIVTLFELLQDLEKVIDAESFPSLNRSENVCNFISSVPPSKEYLTSMMVMPVMAATNILLKIMCCDGQVSNSDNFYVAISAVSLSMSCIDRLSKRASIFKVISILSENDSQLITLLLSVVEVNLRLKHLLYESEIPSPFVPQLSLLDGVLNSNDIQPSRTFNIFLQDCICFDEAVLIDLISSSETNTLEYLTRIVKILYESRNATNAMHSEFSKPVSDFFTRFLTLLKRMQYRNILPFNAELLIKKLKALSKN
jgi:hypothetical protein